MYESFFGFVKRPFLAASTLDRYFPAACIEQTFQTASRAIQRGEGPVAIFGGTGLGKTMCCLRIAESIRRNFEVVMLSSSQLITRRALLQSLLFELRMPYRDMTEGELRLTLMSRLQPSTDNPTDGLVLIIDEAQTMSMKLLDEIRLLTNVVRNGVPRVRLVLCGTMKLDDCLSHPQMDSLNQRLAARCYLTPLSSQETGQYVIHKIELSGVIGTSAMTRDALDAIYRGSDGIPRLIDQLADQSLLLACSERERPVSAAMVGRAWCMLQQLPNPWSEPESIVKSTNGPNLAVSTHSVSNATTPSTPSSTPGQPRLVPTTMSSAKPAAKTSTATTPPATTSSVISSLEMMMKGSVAASGPSTTNSNIEFGQLDDDFQEDETTADGSGRQAVNEESNYEATSDFEDAIARSEIKPMASKNLLDVFAGDFGEEFSIPVQSSDSYQAYSGAAYGNLNYDLSNFGMSYKAPVDEGPLAFDEASDFLTAPTQSQREVLSNTFETVSNISPEQAENLERQIEDEMRDLVSGLNMNAMTFDPTTTIDASARENVAFASGGLQRPIDDRRLSRHSHSDVIAFSGMHNYDSSLESDNLQERVAMDDDRDLLVIEDDLEAVRAGKPHESQSSHRAVLHPYAKLFTKLRNS